MARMRRGKSESGYVILFVILIMVVGFIFLDAAGSMVIQESIQMTNRQKDDTEQAMMEKSWNRIAFSLNNIPGFYGLDSTEFYDGLNDTTPTNVELPDGFHYTVVKKPDARGSRFYSMETTLYNSSDVAIKKASVTFMKTTLAQYVSITDQNTTVNWATGSTIRGKYHINGDIRTNGTPTFTAYATCTGSWIPSDGNTSTARKDEIFPGGLKEHSAKVNIPKTFKDRIGFAKSGAIKGYYEGSIMIRLESGQYRIRKMLPYSDSQEWEPWSEALAYPTNGVIYVASDGATLNADTSDRALNADGINSADVYNQYMHQKYNPSIGSVFVFGEVDQPLSIFSEGDIYLVAKEEPKSVYSGSKFNFITSYIDTDLEDENNDDMLGLISSHNIYVHHFNKKRDDVGPDDRTFDIHGALYAGAGTYTAEFFAGENTVGGSSGDDKLGTARVYGSVARNDSAGSKRVSGSTLISGMNNDWHHDARMLLNAPPLYPEDDTVGWIMVEYQEDND